MCYLHAPGKLLQNEELDFICPNRSCGQLIALHYSDHTCGSCAQFVHVYRGQVIAKLELMTVKPVFGGKNVRNPSITQE